MKKTFLIVVFVFLLGHVFLIPHINAQSFNPDTQPVISMDFQDVSIKDALKIFSMQSGLNFIASEAVQDRKVTLYLDKVPLSSAMDKIFSANNLSYELDKKANIFVVKEWGKMETETVTKIFYLKNATVSTSSLKNQMSKESTKGSGSEAANAASKWKEEVEGGITSAIKKLLSGSGTIVEDYRTNSLIITDTPKKMQVISQVIASLDTPVPQVMLEVEMLDVSKNVVDKMGFEFGDTPFTAIITGATATMGFPYGSWSKILSPGNGQISINPAASTYDLQLDFIRTDTNTKYLARPKILTLNNETAEISITKDEIVGRTDTTVYSSSGDPTITSTYVRSTDLKLTEEGTGIYLKVTPQVSLDTNEITMVVNPKSSISSTSTLSSSGNPQADIEVRSTKSIVKIKDGETVILGGLIHQNKEVSLKKLPFLGDIPILGVLFRHEDRTAGLERELLVFITPHIIRNNNNINFSRLNNFRLPIREQSAAPGVASRDYLINSNMNKFEKRH